MISMHKSVENCQEIPDLNYGIVIGVDISKRKIDYGAYRADEKSKTFSIKQDSEGFAVFKKFVEELEDSGYKPWVAYEPTGPYSSCFKEWLNTSNWRVVQVNPYHVKRTKEVRDNSPGKTDSKDPRVIADLVWSGCYQEQLCLDGIYAELRAVSVEWASLTKKLCANRNELGSLLEVWFPELGDIFKDITCKSAAGIIRRYSSVSEIKVSRLLNMRSTLKKASSGRMLNKAEEIIAAAKVSIAPSCGQGARYNAIIFLLDMIQTLKDRQEQIKEEMNKYLLKLPEAQCMLSMPGTGTISIAGILGECGNINRFKNCSQLEKFLGLNLYEVSSGKHIGRKRISKRGRNLARYLVCNMAFWHMRSKGLYGGYTKELKSKGKKSGEIRVAIARKILRKLYAIARDHTFFDAARFHTGARIEDGLITQQGTQSKVA
jgi:transposase